MTSDNVNIGGINLNQLKVTIWKLIKPLQWRVLWFAHSKFMIGVTGVVLNSKDEVLLQRHTYWPDGSWGLVTGYAESGESLEETVKRELLEETGLKAKVERLIHVRSGFRLRVEVYYLAHIVGSESMRLDEQEVLEAKFFSVTNLPDGILESHREAIQIVIDSK